MKLKIYRVLLVLLIIALIIVVGLIFNKYYDRYQNEIENEEMISVFSSIVSDTAIENEEIGEISLNGYKIIGIVSIPKIDIEYPILDIENPNPTETKIPLKTSIVRYWGGDINSFGNVSIAGHNNYDGTMFGKLKKLEIDDIVKLKDLKNQEIQYRVYKKFETDPNDVSILKTEDATIREVTLITCTNGNKSRLIIKAKEI